MITDKLFTFLKDPKIVKSWYPSGGTNFAALNYWSKNIGNEIQPKHFIFTDGQYLKEHFNMYLLSISKLFNVDINKITSEIIETNLQSYPNTEDPEFQNWIEKKIKLWMDFGSEDEIELKQMGFPKINEVIDSFKTQYSREKNASLLYFCVNDISIGLLNCSNEEFYNYSINELISIESIMLYRHCDYEFLSPNEELIIKTLRIIEGIGSSSYMQVGKEKLLETNILWESEYQDNPPRDKLTFIRY
jgi:hypothetical protein